MTDVPLEEFTELTAALLAVVVVKDAVFSGGVVVPMMTR
jgi:hypothetical protein